MSDHDMAKRNDPHLARTGLGWPALALLGISFTAAGYYAPWSLALDKAGATGALLAFGLTSVFYLCLTRTISELSAAIPSSGAGQAFLSRAFGPAAGFAAGAAALVQWIAGAATLLVILGTYLEASTGVPGIWAGAATYAIILVVLLAGTGEMMALGLITSLAGVAGVLVFLGFAGQSFGVDAATIVWAQPNGIQGIWSALPFCMTFFLGIEGVPFAAEEARDPSSDVPRGTTLAFISIVVLGGLLLLLGPWAVGSKLLAATSEPITVGLSHIRPSVPPGISTAISISAIAALAASLLGSIFAFSRLVFAMARAGELPGWLARLNRRHAPHWGLMIPSVIVLALAMTGLIDQLIILTVVAACISYGMVFAAFVRLRLKVPELERPYRVTRPRAIIAAGFVSGMAIFSACVAMEPSWALLALAMFASLGVYRVLATRIVGPCSAA